MNYIALINFQRIIFSILFILSGLYLIIFLLKEIFMLFIPGKNSINDISELLANNKDIKIIPFTAQPTDIKVIKKEEYTSNHEINKQKTYQPIKHKVKKEKKSRKRRE